MCGHMETKQSKEEKAKRVQHKATATFIRALHERSMAYGDEVERVEVFTYLCRLISFDDRSNMMKAESAGLGSPVCLERKLPHLVDVLQSDGAGCAIICE